MLAKEPTNDIPENPDPSRPVIAPTTVCILQTAKFVKWYCI